jgi:hypothetical protein
MMIIMITLAFGVCSMVQRTFDVSVNDLLTVQIRDSFQDLSGEFLDQIHLKNAVLCQHAIDRHIIG